MDFNQSVLAYLAGVTVRSLGLGLLALAAVLLWRVKSAAARHAVCTALVGGMLVLAGLTPLLPSLPVRILRPERGQVFEPPVLPPLDTRASAPLSAPAPSNDARLSWQQIAVLVYGAGVLGFLIRLAFGYLFTRRLIRASRPIQGPWNGEVCESSWTSVPLTVGWRRPKVLLPRGWDTWPPDKLQAVLAHEQTHVRRGDWAIALWAGLNRSIFWFHPLSWWLERRLAFLAEQACDDAALLLVGTAPYAQALLDMAAAVKAGQGRLVWEAMAMANGAEVRHRIERILDETRQIPKGLTRSRWVALIACSLPLIYLASVVQLAPAQEQDQRQQVSTPRKSAFPPTPESAVSQTMRGKQLSPADVAQMEQYLTTNPQDLDVRSQLVVYYFDHNMREPRLSHIFWLIANHPESTQALFTSRGITPRTTSLNDAADYTRAADLWKQQAASHANYPRVLANAADFLFQPGGDPDEAERLLKSAHQVEPANPEWQSRLAKLYTAAIVGSAGDPKFRNVDSAFADRVKLELENSTDGRILLVTGGMLASVAVRPQPGQKLPNGVLNLDEHPMLTPVVEMGNRLLSRAEQFGMPGVVGPITAGQTMPRTVMTGQAAPMTMSAQDGFAPPLATEPTLLNKVDPVYPPLALQARISGVVKYKAQIGKDGHVQRIEVISGHPLLVPAGLEALKQWAWAPIPAPGSILVDVPFSVDGRVATVTNQAREQSLQTDVVGGVIGGTPGGVIGGTPGGVIGGIIGAVPSAAPPPPPAPYASGSAPTPQRIRIGGAVQASKLASKVDPVYPEQARSAGIDGDVLLDVTIDEDGHVESVAVRDGNPVLATAAVDAVKQWTYRPTLLNGQPVSVQTQVTVPFRLQ